MLATLLAGMTALCAAAEPGTAGAVETNWILSKLEERCDRRDLEESMLFGRALPMDDAVSLAQRYLD